MDGWDYLLAAPTALWLLVRVVGLLCALVLLPRVTRRLWTTWG